MHLFASVHESLFLHVCWRVCMCVLQDAKETKGPKRVFCSWKTRLRAEGEEEGGSPPREGRKWSEGGRGSLRGLGARGDFPTAGGAGGAGGAGAQGQEGPGPGVGWGWGPEPAALLSPARPRPGHTC